MFDDTKAVTKAPKTVVPVNAERIFDHVCAECIASPTKGYLAGAVQYTPTRGKCESCQADATLAPAVRPEHVDA